MKSARTRHTLLLRSFVIGVACASILGMPSSANADAMEKENTPCANGHLFSSRDDSVDGDQIQWWSMTRYEKSITHGVDQWDGLGQIDMPRDTGDVNFLTTDLLVADLDWDKNVLGMYFRNSWDPPGPLPKKWFGIIDFNPKAMGGNTSGFRNKRGVAVHELGHAFAIRDHGCYENRKFRGVTFRPYREQLIGTNGTSWSKIGSAASMLYLRLTDGKNGYESSSGNLLFFHDVLDYESRYGRASKAARDAAQDHSEAGRKSKSVAARMASATVTSRNKLEILGTDLDELSTVSVNSRTRTHSYINPLTGGADPTDGAVLTWTGTKIEISDPTFAGDPIESVAATVLQEEGSDGQEPVTVTDPDGLQLSSHIVAVNAPQDSTLELLGESLLAAAKVRVRTESGSYSYDNPLVTPSDIAWANESVTIVDIALNGQLVTQVEALSASNTVLSSANTSIRVPPVAPPRPPAGTLDSSFGIGGVALTPTPSAQATGNDEVVTPDGGIVEVGYYLVSSGNYRGLVTKHRSDGQPDPSFGSNGQMSFNLSGESSLPTGLPWLFSVINTPNNTLTVAIQVGGNWTALAKITGSGQLDTTFDGNGLKRLFGSGTPFPTSSYYGDIVADTAGRVYFTGSADATGIGYGPNVPVVARLTSQGTLDTTFGGNGYLLATSIPSGRFQGITIDSQGRIVVAGEAGSNPTRVLAARVLPSGTWDSSFSGDGINTFATGTNIEVGAAVDVNSADAPHIAIRLNSNDIAVAKVDPNTGDLDATFGTGGIATAHVPASGSSDHTDLIVANGDLVASTGFGGSPTKAFVVRFDADGGLDSTFDLDGIAMPDSTGYKRTARAIVQLPDGRLVIAGDSTPTASGSLASFMLMAFFS